jgi:hypothetical protein
MKARDPKGLSAWCAEHFGIDPGEGAYLVFDGPQSAGMTFFSHFPQDTSYFGDGPQTVQPRAFPYPKRPKQAD